MGLSTAELAILVKVYDEASASLDQIDAHGKGLMGTLKSLIPAVAGFAAAFASWQILDGAISKTAELGEQVHDLVLKTGLSDEAASHLIHAGEVTGTSYETISKAVGILAKNISNAQNDTSKEADKMSAAQTHASDVVSDAQRRMADATFDANQRMTDAVHDANETITRAFRDRTEAIQDANHDMVNSVRDANRAIMDAQHDVAGAIKQGAKDQADAQIQIGRAQRDLAVAQQDAAKNHQVQSENVVHAVERVQDAQRRLADITDQNKERVLKAQERVTESTERRTEVEYKAKQKLGDIEQKYADTVQQTNERVVRTVRDAHEAVSRTYAEQQEVIARAGVKLSVTQDNAEVDAKAFKRGLDDLGISMKDVTDSSGRLTEKGFDLIADKVSQMPASLRRTADVMAVFGKNGAALEPLFALGSKGLAETSKEADKLGLTLSAENVEKIHAYAEAHRKMQEAIKGIQVEIGIELMPLLTQLAEWFVKEQPAIREFIHEGIEYAKEKFEEWRPEIENTLEGVMKFFGFLRDHKSEVILILIGLTVYFAAMWVAANPAIVLIPALVLLITHLGDIKDAAVNAFNGVKNAITGAISSVIDWIKEHWTTIAAVIAGPFGIAALEIVKHWDTIKDGLKKVLTFLEGIPDMLAGAIGDAESAAYEIGKSILHGIEEGIKSAPNLIKDAINDLIPGPLKKAKDKVLGAIGGLGFHAAGVRYVMEDELALVHKGETIRNAAESKGSGGGLGAIHVHLYNPVLAGSGMQSAAGNVGFAIDQELRSRGYAS